MTEEIPLISESGLIYIHNAGLVLLSPFLPRLFERLSYVKDNHFISEARQQKAALLLQYLVTGRAEAEENEELSLNKLLCGCPEETILPKQADLTEEEQKTVVSLLQGIIAQAGIAGNMSIDGFRGNFLIREGRLLQRNGHLELYVAKKAFDVLLDKLPWSYSTVHFPYMKLPLHTTWR